MFEEMAKQAVRTDVAGLHSNYQQAVCRLNFLCDELNREVGGDETMRHTVAELLQDVIVTARAGLHELNNDTTEPNNEALKRLTTGMIAVAHHNEECESLSCSVSLNNEGAFVVTVTETGSDRVFAKVESDSLSLAVNAVFDDIEGSLDVFGYQNPFTRPANEED